MATPISGMRIASSFLNSNTAADGADVDQTNEIDFDLAEGLGVQILGVLGSYADLDRIDAAAATNELAAVHSLHMETDRVEQASVLEPDTDEVRIDSEIFWHQHAKLHGLEDSTNGEGGVALFISDGWWVPPTELIMVRNITHRLKVDDSALEAAALVRVYWRYVRLTNNEAMMLLTRRT